MGESNEQTRRTYLRVAGGISTLGIAGCIGDGSDSKTPVDEQPATGGSSDSSTESGEETSGDDGTETTEGTEIESGGGTNTDQSAPAKTVELFSNEFAPMVVTIDVGETVEWSLEEGSHTVTLYHRDNDAADHRAPEGAMSFDDSLDDGAFQWTFETEGVYDYYCRPHESGGMVGTVVVGEPENGEPGLTSPSSLTDAAADKIEAFNEITRDEFSLDSSSGGDVGNDSDEDGTSSDDGSGYDGGYE